MSHSLKYQEIYDKLKESLECEQPNKENLIAYILDCGFPNYDKRGVYNQANEVEDYVSKHYSEKIGIEGNYDSILKWIVTRATLKEIKEIISKLDTNIDYLFRWKNQDPDLEYVKMSLFEWIEGDELEDYLCSYYNEINQITDKLIVMNGFEKSSNHLFDYDGNYLNGKIHECIFENFEENCFGGNFQITLGDDDLITVEESGNRYYYSTCKYLLKYTGDKFEMIKNIEDDFELPWFESRVKAGAVEKIFHDKISHPDPNTEKEFEVRMKSFGADFNEVSWFEDLDNFNSSVPENNINSPEEQESIDSDVVQYDNLSITSDFSLSGEFHLFPVQITDYKSHEMVFTCFDQNQFVARGDGFVGIGSYIFNDFNQIEGFYTWKYDNDELKGETLIHIDNNGVFTGKVYIFNDQNEKEFSWEYIAKKVKIIS